MLVFRNQGYWDSKLHHHIQWYWDLGGLCRNIVLHGVRRVIQRLLVGHHWLGPGRKIQGFLSGLGISDFLRPVLGSRKPKNPRTLKP